MAARKAQIDLLSRKELSQRTSGRFLLWALTVGRYIVIFTELLVISGFIFRVALDRTLDHLNEDLLQQKAILASYQPIERKIRHIHDQLTTFSRVEGQRVTMGEWLRTLSQATPTDMRFESLSLDSSSMQITAIALSPEGFSSFIVALQSHPDVTDVVLHSVESGGPQDPGIHFRVSVDFRAGAVQAQIQPATDESSEF